eukprot:6027-Heterococcus_DN1.PRE.2
MPQQPAAVLQALSSGTVVHQKCSRRDGFVFTSVELLCVQQRSKLAVSEVAQAVQRSNLQLILQLVKYWFYTGTVSTEWQQVYRGICEDSASLKRMAGLACDFDLKLGSVERLSMQDRASQMIGLGTFKNLSLHAGRHAEKQTLLL